MTYHKKNDSLINWSLLPILFYIVIALFFSANIATAENIGCSKLLWQIGRPNQSSSEFALAGKNEDFSQRFEVGQEIIFDVQKNQASDFPYIHPGPNDIGWSGRQTIPITISFELGPNDVSSDLIVIVHISDVNYACEPVLQILLDNEKMLSKTLQPGAGRGLKEPNRGEYRVVNFRLPEDKLKPGTHSIQLTITEGSWITYDAIQMFRLDIPQIKERIQETEYRRQKTTIYWDEIQDMRCEFNTTETPVGLEVFAAAINSSLNLADNLANQGFIFQCDFYICDGNLNVMFTKDNARSPYWHVNFSRNQSRCMGTTGETSCATKPGWRRLKVENSLTGAVIKITDLNTGKVLIRQITQHFPGAGGRLTLQAKQGSLAFLNNLTLSPNLSSPDTRNEIRDARYEIPKSSVLENEAFELKVSTQLGLNPYSLFDKQNGLLLANGDYSYAFGQPRQVTFESENIESPTYQGQQVTFTGHTNSLEVKHIFRFPKDEDWFEEQVIVKNITENELIFADRPGRNNPQMRTGFVRTLPVSDEGLISPLCNWQFLAVPFLRATSRGSGHTNRYSLADIMELMPGEKYRPGTDAFGSEGWILTDPNKAGGVLMIKYNQDGMEYSLLDPVEAEGQNVSRFNGSEIACRALRFGGCGTWAGERGSDPEAASKLPPAKSFTFGVTRYVSFKGPWQQGFYLFRQFMDSHGHITPPGFNPLVHWNEIYDNQLWWNRPEGPEKRQEYYQLHDMEEEAAKAKEIGCEALYLDPGWDTIFGSTIWDSSRLLSCKEFCELMQQKYGLKVSLHTPLAYWNHYSAYSADALARDKKGRVLEGFVRGGTPYALCSGSADWWNTKLDRLLKLAEDGVVFFMFDGTDYTGACCVKEHGHSIPYTKEEHVRACAALAEAVHEKFPDVLIEMHDMVLGPHDNRYVPIYYLHNEKTFDSVWAFEYMLDCKRDMLNGTYLSLYYYNLAYNIPLYIHFDLREDNENALIFWWFASTCRHLGFGGKHKNPAIWQAHKDAMKTYLRLKPFFTQGEFYGVDEMTHIHTLKQKNAAVVNCFNLQDVSYTKNFSFKLSEVGLSPETEYTVKGADSWQLNDGEIEIQLVIPALGTRLLEIELVQ